jgi:hypothetical protein
LPAAHVSADHRRIREDLSLRHLALGLPGLRETVYRLPPFALPHKRFVTSVIGDRSQAFLGPTQSYRDTVRRDGRALVYDDRQDGALARRGAALSHSTVWRWLSWLGDSLQETFREARRLICAAEPRSTLHRQACSVSPAKYRSDPRRQTLERALQGLMVTEVFQQLFGKAIFPNFATCWNWH